QGPFERGDDEARIAFALGPLGLADYAPLAAPAFERLPHKLLETAGGRTRLFSFRLGRLQLARNLRHKPLILGQPEHVIHAICLTPGHQFLARKAAIGTKANLHFAPARSDLRYQARNLLDGTGGCIDVGATQLGCQQMAAAEDIKRQIAVAVVVAMEKSSLLMPVQGAIGGIAWRPCAQCSPP